LQAQKIQLPDMKKSLLLQKNMDYLLQLRQRSVVAGVA
jgi:hypothetical protein